MKRLLVCFFVMSAFACADDIDPSGDDESTSGSTDTSTSNIVSTQRDDGSTASRINASSSEAWIYFDLDTGLEVTPAEPETSSDWDIAFQRYNVKVNGGASGAGNVEMAVVAEVALGSFDTAPSTGYVTDNADGDDADSTPDYAMLQLGDWYDYNQADHTLLPKSRVFVVHSSAGAYFKLTFESYYDEAGSSGHPLIVWMTVNTPDGTGPSDTFDVDVSSGSAVYVSLASHGVVGVTEAWDLVITGAAIGTNSGASGTGFGGALLSAVTYDGLTGTDTVGFVVDALAPAAGPPGTADVAQNAVLSAWYAYDVTTHVATPLEQTYVVRGGDGAYYALAITNYASAGVFTLRAKPVARAAIVHTATLEVPLSDTWAYFSLRDGVVVTPDEPSTDLSWDMAFQYVYLATNSGLTASGDGGALATEAATLEALSIVTAGEKEVDAEITAQGQSGTTTYVANPVLDDWYDYDMTTHVVSPQAKVFVVYAADGSFAKVLVTSYDYASSSFGIAWVYAGPNASSF